MRFLWFTPRAMKKSALLAVIVASLSPTLMAEPPAPIRYVAIGDSYSIGEGASREQAWPAVLARHLSASGVAVELVANPSRTGWTTEMAINQEMPVAVAAKPAFITVQIGVNDWVRGVDAALFRQRLNTLLDKVQALLPDKTKLLVVNIPDFSVTPTGASFSNGRDISAGLSEFNKVIAEEAGKRQLKVIDVFAVSKDMAKDRTLIADDGLHPSAKEYAVWEKLIFPAALELLKPAAK